MTVTFSLYVSVCSDPNQLGGQPCNQHIIVWLYRFNKCCDFVRLLHIGGMGRHAKINECCVAESRRTLNCFSALCLCVCASAPYIFHCNSKKDMQSKNKRFQYQFIALGLNVTSYCLRFVSDNLVFVSLNCNSDLIQTCIPRNVSLLA